MTQAAEEVGSPCGYCRHPECRECFPWPDSDSAEMRAIREEMALLKGDIQDQVTTITDLRATIRDLNLQAAQLAPRKEGHTELEILLMNERAAKSLALDRSAADSAQLRESVAFLTNHVNELETEIVRLKEFEYRYESVSK